MKPYCLIVNPNAGRGRGRLTASRVESALRQEGLSWDRFDTHHSGDGERIARELPRDGYSRILVISGDGTLNEVIQGLPLPNTPVAVIPAGTGNDVARMIGVNREEKAIKTAIEGDTKAIDLGMAAGKPFINIFSFGLDAAIATQANLWKNVLPGWLLYPAALVKTILTFKAPQVTIQVKAEGETRERKPEKILLMAVCNGGHYGGGMHINPMADPFDEKLEMCVVREMPWWKILFLFPTVYKGTHLRFREVSLERVSEVSFRSDQRMLLNRDGETLPGQEGQIYLVPGALTVIWPKEQQITAGEDVQ